MGKGSNTTTTNSSSSSYARPDENAYQAYLQLMNRASGVAGTAYQGYGGQETAGINDQQRAGISGVNQQFDFLKGQEQPLSAAAIRQYMDPYTSEVIDATQRDFDVQNERGLSQVKGNAASIGALGGDREAVAAALTKEGQTRAQSPIIAGLRSAGYQNAVNTAAGQQDKMLRAGIAAQEAAKTQFGMGTHEQQTEQAQLTQDRLDYYQQQGYPFQVAQWLAQMTTGVGSQLGGYSSTTGTSTSQGPKPNPWAQVAGLGLTAAGMFAADGGRVGGVHQFADGGALRLSPEEMDAFHAWSAEHARHGYAGGGSPYGTEQTWVPTVSGIAAGRGAPSAPSLPSAPSAPKQQGLSADQMKGIGAVGAGLKDWWNDDSGSAVPEAIGMTSIGSGESGPMPLVSPGTIDWSRARGGGIRNYARSGAVGIGAAAPAYEADDVINPDEPYRMQGSPQEYDAAMRSIDSDIGRGQTATPVKDVPLPPEVMSGRSKPAPEDDGEPVDAPSEPMGYASRPRPQRGVGAPGYGPEASAGVPDAGFLSRMGVQMTPELKQGLLQAGLAMMATRHGGPGSFLSSLGEAGMTGVGAYNATQANALAQFNKDRLQAREDEKFGMAQEKFDSDRASSPLIRGPDGKMMVNPAWVKMKEKERELTADKFSAGDMYVGPNGDMIPTSRDMKTGRLMNAITGEPLTPEQGGKFVNSKRHREVNPEEARAVAEYYVKTGDMSRINALGLTSEARQAVQSQIRHVQKELGVTDEELATKNVEFAGRKAGQRTLGVMEAKMGAAALEAEGAIKLARGIIEKLPRTSFLPFNKLLEGYSKNTLNPDQAELYARAQAIVNTYSAVMSRGANITTDSSRHHAAELLNTAADPTTFNRVLDTMLQEIDMAKNSPLKMREFYKKMYGRDPGDATKEKEKADPASSAGTPPPEALAKLKEGEPTTFGNGQTWTLKGGNPVRVK